MIEDRINQDLKQALLNKETHLVEILRGLKSVILYAKISANLDRSVKLEDEAMFRVLASEVKKAQESADLFLQGGSKERSDKSLKEKAIISSYLPTQLTTDEVEKIVDEILAKKDSNNMGQIIAEVKVKTVGRADGSLIAQIVKAKLMP